MRSRRFALAAIGVAAIAVPAVAQGQTDQIFTLAEQQPFGLAPYELEYHAVRDRAADAFGEHHVGRDIVVDGVFGPLGTVRVATRVEVVAATNRIRDRLKHAHELEHALDGMPAAFSGYATRATVQCESGGDYTTDTGNGYYGAYQFDQQTWDSWAPDAYVGTNPADAPAVVQDVTAAAVRSDAWPNC